MKYQVMKYEANNKLRVILPVNQTTFDNLYDAKILAINLSAIGIKCAVVENEHTMYTSVFHSLHNIMYTPV